MQTIYHLSSAQEIPDIIESTIAACKSKAITVTDGHDEDGFDITDKMMGLLYERLFEADNVFFNTGTINQPIEK